MSSAVHNADAVLAALPASGAHEVASRCASLLRAGALYVDFASASPEQKLATGELVAAAGGSYVDAAVLGTVLTSGFKVPILASGPGANAWEALVAPDGLRVSATDAPAGHAALVKLLRGIYLKGRDALIVEMLLTAKRYGLEELVAATIDGPGERVPFSALAERVLCSLALHAERRADELSAASELIRCAGIDPALARAGSETLRGVAALGLTDAFADGRPADGRAVLAVIDSRWEAQKS